MEHSHQQQGKAEKLGSFFSDRFWQTRTGRENAHQQPHQSGVGRNTFESNYLDINSLTSWWNTAFWNSWPLLLSTKTARELWTNSTTALVQGLGQLVYLLLPKWYRDRQQIPSLPTAETLRKWWQQASQQQPPDFMLRHFDTNQDGHISPAELLNMTDIIKRLSAIDTTPESWWAWFSREWPLMDWKMGVFLWRTFDGIIILFAILTILPGRVHGISAKVLRWPVLSLVYFLIAVELMVYIVIRLFIMGAETMIMRPKHRKLRRLMAQAKTYHEWYRLANMLDASQRRDRWLSRLDDDQTSYRYNWGFIRELMEDMRKARTMGDAALALAIIQQCTRKNVGGIMSEDLFSYSNTGEPKYLVKEFVEEVVTTLEWITDRAVGTRPDDEWEDLDVTEHESKIRKQVRGKKDGLWQSLLTSLLDNQPNKRRQSSSDEDETHDQQVHSASSQATMSSTNSVLERINSNDTLSNHGGISSNASPTRFLRKDGSEPIRPLPTFRKSDVLSLLHRARAAYGRTALCLSGGAMMGLYHFGHVLGLLETGMLPHIISGTSAGSVVGSVLCTRTDQELRRDLKAEVLVERLICFNRSWIHRIQSLIQTGNMFDFDEWMDLIKWFTCGDMTFKEAYEKTGRVLSITLSSTTKKAPPVLLNFLTAPDVTIASAIVASAAVPGLIPAVRLRYKDANGIVSTQGGEKNETFFDGSIRQDIPMSGLAEMFNCQFFIACQCNPHIVPFFFGPKGSVGRPSRWSSGNQVDSFRGGFLLAALEMYLKNDMKAKFRFLNDLEAAVGFTSTLLTQEYEGSTTIVPDISFSDYFKLVSNPSLSDIRRYMHVGRVAAYKHVAMIKLHYSIADMIDSCIARLESDEPTSNEQPF